MDLFRIDLSFWLQLEFSASVALRLPVASAFAQGKESSSCPILSSGFSCTGSAVWPLAASTPSIAGGNIGRGKLIGLSEVFSVGSLHPGCWLLSSPTISLLCSGNHLSPVCFGLMLSACCGDSGDSLSA